MKTILGLDLGTNSIGWALINQDFEKKTGAILGMGSRIIPMSQDILGDFGKGNSVSQTAERTKYRSMRRLRERHLLRRERLHRVLNLLGYLPPHYADQIDFEKRFGKFKGDSEPKLAYDTEGFIFKNSFLEMLDYFKKAQPEFLKKENGTERAVPYDWTIYYLRKKALSEKIEPQELAWIILNFNQKRGYYQLRGEEEDENPNKRVEFHSLKVVNVFADEQQKGKAEIGYTLELENGWNYRRASKKPLFDWKGKVKDFIVTTELNQDGSIKTEKDGKEKRNFRAPTETDWTLVKKKTEHEIDASGKSVGTFIFNSLLQNPTQKIKGKLVRTIERKFYKKELIQILQKQREFHPELSNIDLFHDCIRELYKNNELHRDTLKRKDFVHLFIEDIIFYQRPLRSQKSNIANCPLESRTYVDKDGVQRVQSLKAVPKSNPYYQEFRLWQWLSNLHIYKKEDDTNITNTIIKSPQEYEALFEFLNHRNEIDQKTLLKFLKLNDKSHRWNYVEDKLYPCNKTRHLISTKIAKVVNLPNDFLTKEVEYTLWHIIYSVTDKIEYEKALRKFAAKQKIDEPSFFEAFRNIRPFESEFGSYSEKAIKKLLPLMRLGRFWDWKSIDDQSKNRIEKIITGEYDEEIRSKVRDKAIDYKTENDFQGLPLWLAQYIVYNRHSEAASLNKWKSVDELDHYIRSFRQHSLRNPIVEQVIIEALRVVRDIWTKFGNGRENFFDEIHIELGRDMKLSANERKRMTSKLTESENTNLRIKLLLAELFHDSTVENVRPFSPMQFEILKIYEDGVLNSGIEIDDDILKISKTAQPSTSELRRYKLWLEQKYRSPYTGNIIPLNKLFTHEYEIEHIIPQSLYFDDSFNNKVICESAVNKLKGNYLGLPFIKQFGGTIIEPGLGQASIRVLKQDEYEEFVKRHYEKSRNKRAILLLEEIPDKMIERQINDTRYISKFISSALSNIVRVEDGSDEGVNSKNIVPGNGKITTTLKQDWGLNDVWNDIILPRFERLNRLTNSTSFTAWSDKHQKFLPTVPIEHSTGFSKKRIDHRHHALDALVIACATRDHVNLLNNQSAKSETKRYDLKRKLMQFEKAIYTDPRTGKIIEREIPKRFLKPWETFTVDAKNRLDEIIVSFKQNLRVINKATNYYEKFVEVDGVKVKSLVKQSGVNWAIRKAIHKETVSGKVNLPWVKLPKGKILTATRKAVDTSFNIKTIESITDTGIQKILKAYLKHKGSPEVAFSPEGLEDLNKNISFFNDGKPHKPIKKVRIFEMGSKFQVGFSKNKMSKYVEAAKGTNLFFAIYTDSTGKRSYVSVPLNEVIERQKQGLTSCPEINNLHNLKFHLSPNDLVVILDTQTNTENSISCLKPSNIYKFVSCTGGEGHFIPHTSAREIIKNENGTNSKSERMQDFNDGKCLFDANSKPIMIKEKCSLINIDRLGFISRLT